MTKETKEVFKLHDIDSAPEKSKKHLAFRQKKIFLKQLQSLVNIR